LDFEARFLGFFTGELASVLMAAVALRELVAKSLRGTSLFLPFWSNVKKQLILRVAQDPDGCESFEVRDVKPCMDSSEGDGTVAVNQVPAAIALSMHAARPLIGFTGIHERCTVLWTPILTLMIGGRCLASPWMSSVIPIAVF
jgi:hypothetical protein